MSRTCVHQNKSSLTREKQATKSKQNYKSNNNQNNPQKKEKKQNEPNQFPGKPHTISFQPL